MTKQTQSAVSMVSNVQNLFVNILNTSKYTEKRVEYSNTISVLMESSAAELRSLENARDSCCTLHIRANSIYEPYRVHMIQQLTYYTYTNTIDV